MTRMLSTAFVAVIALHAISVACEVVAQAPADAPVAKPTKPLTAPRLHLTPKPMAPPRVKSVFEGDPTPLVRDWAQEAAQVVIGWWPQVARLLTTENFVPPDELALVFRREIRRHRGDTRRRLVLRQSNSCATRSRTRCSTAGSRVNVVSARVTGSQSARADHTSPRARPRAHRYS